MMRRVHHRKAKSTNGLIVIFEAVLRDEMWDIFSRTAGDTLELDLRVFFVHVNECPSLLRWRRFSTAASAPPGNQSR
jgi:hypothetical protein